VKAPLTKDQQALVVEHLRLAERMARDRVNPFVPFDDRHQHARIGLIDAARRYDPSLGFAFSTYAGKCIWAAIRDGERESGFFGNSRNLSRARKAGYAVPKIKLVGGMDVEDRIDDGRDQIASDVLFVAPDETGVVDDRDEVEAAMSCLADRDRRIVLAWSLHDGRQRRAAEAVGVTESLVSKVLPKLLERLRSHSALSHYAKGA
jgi:RNA polymerase sigma factor (sigma-70 family)